MIVVSNATPLIALASIGQFDLLERLFKEIFVSRQVWQEVVVEGNGRFGALETSQSPWIHIVELDDPAKLYNWTRSTPLGAGELSTILLAKQIFADLVLIDERQARKLALNDGLAIAGSIALLESGYRRKYFNDLRQLYIQLLGNKIRLSRRLLNESLTKFQLSPI